MYYYIHRFQSTYIGDGWKRLARGTKCWDESCCFITCVYMLFVPGQQMTALSRLGLSLAPTSTSPVYGCFCHLSSCAHLWGWSMFKTSHLFVESSLGKPTSQVISLKLPKNSLRTSPPNNIIYNTSCPYCTLNKYYIYMNICVWNMSSI